MTKKSTLFLSLSLAALLTGLAGCAKETTSPEEGATTGEEQAAQEGQAQAPGSPSSTPGAPGQPGAAAQEKPISPDQMPAVVAKVNGQEIKKEELLRSVQEAQMQLAQSGRLPQGAPPASFYRDVLNGMIARSLFLQEAKAQGIQADAKEIDQKVAELKSRFPNPEAFQQALASQGLTEQALRTQAQTQLTVEKYVQSRVFDKVSVTDQQAKTFYDQNQARMKEPERLRLRHILIRVDENAPEADKQKAREKADSLLARIKGGEDFAKLAQENSDDPGSKARGGELPPMGRGETVPPFEQAAFALQKPNDLSGVVQSQFGYHIIQLLERIPESQVPFEQAKGQIVQMLRQQQAQKQLEAQVQALKAKGKVETYL
ncbi:MAG TPA: peptidylprolyl isomerase [Thermoanaerobaculia bacterium]|nr:peptidylprolyl isomerase [Thermoanaerobaculia bacterium]